MNESIQMFNPLIDYKKNLELYKNAINEVLESGLYINGPKLKELEKKLENYINVKHCITVSNGTMALLLALKALDIKENDEIITVSYSWISTVEVIEFIGAKPIYVDIKENDFCINEDLIEKKITEKTKAILFVSLFGQTPNIDKINLIAKKYNLYVIEDAAQSFGSKYKNRYSCSMTDIACTSFYPTKPLGCFGDGGACFTNNKYIANKLLSLRNHGSLVRYQHIHLGLNARFNTLQAAVLLVKLNNFKETIEKRRLVARYYLNKLKDINSIKLPSVNLYSEHVWAQFTIIMKNKLQRNFVFNYVKNKNINIALFYPNELHKQPCFKKNNIKLQITNNVCNRILNLPIYAELSKDKQNKVCEIFKEAIDIFNKKYVKINIALIGCGYWGKNYIKTLNNLNNYFNIVGIVDLNTNIKNLYPNYKITNNINDIIDEVDSFIIATPAHSHFKIAELCLTKNKHILIEKPFVMDIKNGKILCKLAKKNNLKLQVGYLSIFMKGIEYIKNELVTSNDKIIQIYFKRSGLFDKDRGCNIIYDLTCHDMSIIYYLLGEIPNYISSIKEKVNSNIVNLVNINMKTPSNILINGITSWIDQEKSRIIEVITNKKKYVYNDLIDEKVKIYHNDGRIEIPFIEKSLPLTTQCIDFYKNIVENKEPLINGYFGLKVNEILDKI